ncbi:hypothetical protein BTA51_06005 [Hahella sp. CCB-MM4]|uniref:DUF6559 family protein n=1 Tax=Hahella sp. (strain CCB-MM4) TaxID=1926491 RepID=UPI000B9A6FC9|nr:DUF6559 family protein [Hahella sp. CCB-MM4]OZG74549.1 hypothetical protein BTA51_06005 [Hahella sp. CCB-MM4]
MNIVDKVKRKEAIRKYIGVLGPELRKRHGKQKGFSGAEVKQAIASLELSDQFIPYALALYCSKEDYEKAFPQPGGKVMNYAEAKTIALNIALAGSSLGAGDDAGDVEDPV